MPGTQLYGTQLFGNSTQSTIVRHANNAPVRSSAGHGGVDQDVARRIGGVNMRSGNRLDGSNKGRVQGICCGITAGWVVALLGGNESATDHDSFASFFTTLRFQGAYVKDHKPNSGSVELLMQGFGLRNSNTSNAATEMTDVGLISTLPGEDGTWAGYISAYGHAVGIGYRNYRYYMMEPNGGLFEYRNKGKFASDLTAFLKARRDRKDAGGDAKMSAYFYKA